MRTRAARGFRLAAVLVFLLGGATIAQSQQPPQYLKSLSPAGGRSYLTESWGALGFVLSNPTDNDLDARLLTFYANAPGRQYGRDTWVPARATLRSWSCIGPPATPPERNVAELKSLLYAREGNEERLLRSPQGPPLHSDLVRFSRPEPATTLLLDVDLADGLQDPLSPREQDQASDLRDLVRVFRHQARLSERINSVKERFLPPIPEALEGTDHFVLASDRIADDVAGRRALREWLERGGTLWVLLDQVRQETVTALLGDTLDFQVVDRVSLSRVQFRNGPANPHRAEPPPVDLEDPVAFVRVLAPRHQALYLIDGWPAAFVTEVGRGRVLFTTLGPRGWMRPRLPRDGRPTFVEFPTLPVPLVPFEFLAEDLHPRPERPLFAPEDLRDYVTEQISYSVVGRKTVWAVFGVFFLVLTGVTVALGRKRILEHLGWLGPVLALGVGGVFVALGEASRGAVPPSVAMVQFVDAVPGVAEVQTSGYLAVYQPSLSATPIGANQGGHFELDVAGLEGRVFRRVQSDPDRWRWDNLELPAGVRVGPFRHTLRTAEPVEATVRFGPNGGEGRLTRGPFRELEDVVVSAPGQRLLAVRLAADGSFLATSDDELAAGQLMAGGLLSDRQRARQRLYEKLLAEPQPRAVANRSLLLAWAQPVDPGFTLAADAQTKGAALLAIPLQFDRTPPGTRVTVPAAFVGCRRITTDGRHLAPATESPLATTMRFRFQLPGSVLPLVVDGARFTLKINAPGREVAVAGYAGGEEVPLRRMTSPLGTEVVEINDRRLLVPDEQGVILVKVEIGEARSGSAERNVWRVEAVGMEVRGKTPAEGRGVP